MNKKLIPLAALSLALGACATSPYGGMGYGDPVTSAIGVLGSVLGSQGSYRSPYGGGYGYSNSGFSQAAVSACGKLSRCRICTTPSPEKSP